MAAHRYWRLNFSGHNGGSGYRIQEVEMRTAAGGADVCSGGTASASNSTIGFPPANAFDNSGLTHWDRTSSTAWLKYDFGAGNDKDIVELAIVASNLVNKTPKDFTLQWSDDDSAWTAAMTLTTITGWEVGQRRIFNSSGETSDSAIAAACRYWRLVASAIQAGITFSLAEIELRESAGGVDATGSGTAENGTDPVAGDDFSDAFDGSATTYWSVVSSVLPGWGRYDFGSGVTKTIVEIALKAHATDPDRSPTAFKLQRSDDGVRWAAPDIDLSGITGWTVGQTRYFDAEGETSGTPTSSARPVVFACT